jgi:7-cyano-7-deazaguanine synthase
MRADKRKAVVLLSGGIDSTTTLAIAKGLGFEIYALTFRYGQRHAAEAERAARIAGSFGVVRHIVTDIDLRMFGPSALTGGIDVPKSRSAAEIGRSIPATYVPARNTIFLSFALAWAEALRSRDIFIGANSVDYSGYPDCRPEYLEAFRKMANLATKEAVEGGAGIRINAPLIRMTKAEIIRKGISLGVDYSMTLSCYDPAKDGGACGECDSCLLRKKGFREAGASDPTRYIAPAGAGLTTARHPASAIP